MEGRKQGGPHPTQQELASFMRGELPRNEALGVVRHLLTGCPECVKGTRLLWQLGQRPPDLEAIFRELAALVRGRPVHDEPGLI